MSYLDEIIKSIENEKDIGKFLTKDVISYYLYYSINNKNIHTRNKELDKFLDFENENENMLLSFLMLIPLFNLKTIYVCENNDMCKNCVNNIQKGSDEENSNTLICTSDKLLLLKTFNHLRNSIAHGLYFKRNQKYIFLDFYDSKLNFYMCITDGIIKETDQIIRCLKNYKDINSNETLFENIVFQNEIYSDILKDLARDNVYFATKEKKDSEDKIVQGLINFCTRNNLSDCKVFALDTALANNKFSEEYFKNHNIEVISTSNIFNKYNLKFKLTKWTGSCKKR